ncbi:integrase, catalytic region, zinc finger, CCHC-type containing protein [Tanacetum coccineum]|uniref:Integrase, catalytic region, zinc finger, CCHC-type containing protein n=1 Tax=Tanacetum coccineum TaxID=301880 RepID=A0ABQ5BMT9_9ASTR
MKLRKNLLTEKENLIVACLSKDVFYTATDSVLTVSRFSDMHNAYTAAQKHIAELEVKNSNLTQKIQKDDHDKKIKKISKLEVEHLNLQLKYQHLKERFGNKKSVTSSDAPAFESVFEFGHLKEQLQALDSQNKDLNAKVNALQDLNERFRVENKKVKQHYKELYDPINLTCAKTIDKTTSLLTKIETLKAQIKGKTKCVTMPGPVKPKVLAPGMYAIDVEPVPPRNRNNREVHLDYLKHHKESVGTLCEIAEDELLEYVIVTCPKDFNKRDRKIVAAPLNRKKRVTFIEPGETSTNNSQTHAKSDKKKEEDHSRNNKSSVKQKNRVDSSISYKRTVIQIVLRYLDSGCSKHMTGVRSRLKNFVKKFIGTVRFRNDHFGAIMGYGDYVIGDRTPQQNGVVERRNRTLVEAARTMLIFSKALMFLWAEAVATACYTQN